MKIREAVFDGAMLILALIITKKAKKGKDGYFVCPKCGAPVFDDVCMKCGQPLRY